MLTEPRRRNSVSERSSPFRLPTSSGVTDCTLPGYFSRGIPSAGSGVAPITVIPGSAIGGFVSDFSGSIDGVCAAAGERARRTSRSERRMIDNPLVGGVTRSAVALPPHRKASGHLPDGNRGHHLLARRVREDLTVWGYT